MRILSKQAGCYIAPGPAPIALTAGLRCVSPWAAICVVTSRSTGARKLCQILPENESKNKILQTQTPLKPSYYRFKNQQQTQLNEPPHTIHPNPKKRPASFRHNLQAFYSQMEAAIGFEPMNNGFADRCLSHLAMPPRKSPTGSKGLNGFFKKRTNSPKGIRKNPIYPVNPVKIFGAGNGARTRDNHVGNVGLYQLSYSRSPAPIL